jgi:hypothetical protein
MIGFDNATPSEELLCLGASTWVCCPGRRHHPVRSPFGAVTAQRSSTSAIQRVELQSPCRPRFAPGGFPGRSKSAWSRTRGHSRRSRRSGPIWFQRGGSVCGAPPAPNGTSFAFGGPGRPSALPSAVYPLRNRDANTFARRTVLPSFPNSRGRPPNLTRQGTPEASARPPSVLRRAFYLPQFAPAALPASPARLGFKQTEKPSTSLRPRWPCEH